MTSHVHTTLRVSSKSGPVVLGKELGKGGEGAVYEIANRPDVVAKIYHKPVDVEKAEKIEAQASMKANGLLSLTAWPLELLRTAGNEPCGFVMPKISGYKDIHTLYNPRSRKLEFPSADWRFLVRSSVNVAKAFAEIHTSGCVIGDVNHGGITVSDKATVRLIDCDSFQVSVGGRLFLCEVGVPTFTAPELQNKKTFRGVVRTTNHDNFGLGVMIFQLLLMGRHPFAGRFLGRGDIGLEQAIAEFRFAYGTNGKAAQMEPPPNAPTLALLSPLVAQLFERAFSKSGANGARPTAKEWILALEDFEKRLKRCQVYVSHYYFNELSRCPWCNVEATTGVLLFTFHTQLDLPGSATFDITATWTRINTLQSPGPATALATRESFGVIVPCGEATSVGRTKFARYLLILFTIGLVILLCMAVPAAWVLWIMGGVFLSSAIGNQNANNPKALAFAVKHRTATAQYVSIKGRWDREASDLKFTTKMCELENLRNEWKEIPSLRQRRYQQLERQREKQQLERYLDTFLIEDASIPGIGAGRKAVLESFNIETAFDITRGMRVPGFGPALTEKLMDWRRSIEQKFRFDSSKGIDPRDIANLDREISEIRRKIEQALTSGPGELNQIKNQILAQRKVLEMQINLAYKAMLQAEADSKAAKG